MLGAYLTLDDEPSELDEQVLEMSPAMTKLFMHARDRLVTEALDTLVSGRGPSPLWSASSTVPATCPPWFTPSQPAGSSQGTPSG
jgi:hypothetical protein